MTAALGLAPAPARRRIGLAPMIDVVFLLLVFFLLAARFGAESAVPIAAGGAGQGWSGPPRLVEVEAGGALRLNGAPIEAASLGAALAALSAGPEDAVALRAREGATAQALADALAALEAAGARRVLLLESRDAP